MSPRMEKWIRRLMALTVLAVAVFAAIQSYTHHYDLAQAHHESGASLRLYPLSVDWLMLAAGLVYLVESHKHSTRPKLPLLVLWAGIGATLAGNIAALWIYGPVAVLIGAWGPVCLVLTIEMGMYLVRSMGAKPAKQELSPMIHVNGTVDEETLARLKAGLDDALGRPAPAPEGVPAQDALQGWQQLGPQQGAGLQGIGLRNGRD